MKFSVRILRAILLETHGTSCAISTCVSRAGCCFTKSFQTHSMARGFGVIVTHQLLIFLVSDVLLSTCLKTACVDGFRVG